MIAVDTNILVYAYREGHLFHARAVSCLRSLAEGHEPWAVPWPCVHEFISVVTNPRIPPGAVTMAAAVQAVEAWTASPTLTLLAESAGHWAAIKRLALESQVKGPMIHDARIAALCLQHGVRELWSADRDFGRFAGLRVVNPLVSPA